MSDQAYELGMVGLGVMGRNLLLNMADHGLGVAGFDADPAKVDDLAREAEFRNVAGAKALEEFLRLLAVPRTIMMLVPAGPPVDAVIRELLPYLQHGDLLIDGGNSHFVDTDLRQKTLAEKGIDLLGVGISGGEHGARHGPSIMPGGPAEAYARVRPLFETISAHVHGEPCAAYMGPGSAGHYVKMVHNGIEYGLIQLIAESYALMKLGLGMNDDDLHEIFARWDRTELTGYLIEITADIFCRSDDKTGRRLIDVILDEARQKGTGMWPSQNAMELQVPTPTIDAAVSFRDLSGYGPERRTAAACLAGPSAVLPVDRDAFLEQLTNALVAGMIIVYAQGMSLLQKASVVYKYGLNLATIARIWRGGCIIRSEFLEPIRDAWRRQPELPNLMMDAHFAGELMMRQGPLRVVVSQGLSAGIPMPGFAGALAYYDGFRSAWLPANLIQAQRDYFGAHTYERIDAKGVFHTQWQEEFQPAVR
jgi:6-phosphogluconate dehydrogenase